MINFSNEIKYKTARSGGSGGQNVNKVETMVVGYWEINASTLFTDEQKQLIFQKLANKINADGMLMVKSQTERTQLGNRTEVLKKMIQLVKISLQKPKPRKPSKIPKAVKEKRLANKKMASSLKTNRKKVNSND